MAFSQDNDVILIKLEGVGNPTVYVPVASKTVKGIASFDSEHFDVNEGKVGFKTDILIGWTERIETLESNKVDKVAGKGLSTNDLTNELKAIYDTASNKINAVTEGAGTSHDTIKKLYDMIVALIGTADILKLADATVLVDEIGNPFEDENGRYFVPECVDTYAREQITSVMSIDGIDILNLFS